MKVMLILLGAILGNTVLARNLGVRNVGRADRGITRDGADWNLIAQHHRSPSSQESRLTARRFIELHHEYGRIQSRSANAAPVPVAEADPDMLAGIKKMVSTGLNKHAPKIAKFAHTKLQEQLNRFMGPKQKGKEKTGKPGDKSPKEKDPSKQTRDLFGGPPELAGPGVLARFTDHMANNGEGYLNTLMTLHGMAQHGADFLEPERRLLGYE